MEIVIDNTDAAMNLAMTVFMGALDDLRSAKKALEGQIGCEVAEALLDGSLLADFANEEAARIVKGFRKTLDQYRDARAYFMDSQSNASYHATVVGLDGQAAVSRVRVECVLPWNSRLVAKACEDFMSLRMKYANK